MAIFIFVSTILVSSYQLYFVFAGGILSSLDIYVIHSDFDDLMRKMQFMVQSSIEWLIIDVITSFMICMIQML